MDQVDMDAVPPAVGGGTSIKKKNRGTLWYFLLSQQVVGENCKVQSIKTAVTASKYDFI